MSSASSRTFEDVKVGVRCKIAALWIAMLFLFAYGDIFGFLRPGQIQEVMAGEISGMAITQEPYGAWRYRPQVGETRAGVARCRRYGLVLCA